MSFMSGLFGRWWQHAKEDLLGEALLLALEVIVCLQVAILAGLVAWGVLGLLVWRGFVSIWALTLIAPWSFVAFAACLSFALRAHWKACDTP